jgi:hypothetical protein
MINADATSYSTRPVVVRSVRDAVRRPSVRVRDVERRELERVGVGVFEEGEQRNEITRDLGTNQDRLETRSRSFGSRGNRTAASGSASNAGATMNDHSGT